MTGASEWTGGVGRTWAAEWRRTDRSLAGVTEPLLAAIRPLRGADVIDIGCGAGEITLALAKARPGARVLGLDISPDLVAAATMRAQGRPNCAFALADAARWEPDRGAPDLYVSRHGVMFFGDPTAAFSHLARVAADAARLCFSCFRSPGENTWASGIAALLPDGDVRVDPHAPGPFAFADAIRVGAILSAAGWEDVAFSPVDFAYVAGSGDDPIADAVNYLGRIGPAARAMRDLPQSRVPALRERLRAFVAEHVSGDTVTFDAAAWVVTATKAPQAA